MRSIFMDPPVVGVELDTGMSSSALDYTQFDLGKQRGKSGVVLELSK
jgi:hypothetical protein